MHGADFDRGSTSSGSATFGDHRKESYNDPSPAMPSDDDGAVFSLSRYRKEKMLRGDDEIEERDSDDDADEDYVFPQLSNRMVFSSQKSDFVAQY